MNRELGLVDPRRLEKSKLNVPALSPLRADRGGVGWLSPREKLEKSSSFVTLEAEEARLSGDMDMALGTKILNGNSWSLFSIMLH